MPERTDQPLTLRAGAHEVQVTHPDRPLFPSGVTKADLARYYLEVAPAMVPLARDRPVALQRFPGGIDRHGFFQKAVPDYYPDWITRVEVGRRDGSLIQLMIEEAATLVYLANQDAITPHVFLSRADEIEQPDRLIFDLDPTGVTFDEVRRGAMEIGDALRDRGLEPFAMTTGSRGIHVTVPLRRGPDFDEVRAWARELAEEMVERSPERFTLEARRARRGNHILIDIMRNAYAQHAVAPYAVRARATAPVAMPLHWDELEDAELAPDRWDVHSALRRLNGQGDAWDGIASHARRLP